MKYDSLLSSLDSTLSSSGLTRGSTNSGEDNRSQIFIAYSGGLDSHVLLHMFAELRKNNPDLELTAVHVNHNISSKATAWDKHCQKVCQDLDVKYISESINPNVNLKNYSLEEVLRDLRYEVFSKALPKDVCLVTAHHANDQAETLLLQLFRGAGPKGLASMPRKIKFAQGWLVRPLLGFSREELEKYARENKLEWVEDESNRDKRFDRNFIRHDLIDLIKKKWPGVVGSLNRVASHCAESSKLLENLAEQDLAAIKKDQSLARCKSGFDPARPDVLDLQPLKRLEFIRQKNVLRFWLHQLGLVMPSETKIKEVISAVINSRYDGVPVVRWGGAEVRRFRKFLYAMKPLEKHDNTVELYFDENNKLTLPGNLGVLQIDVPLDCELTPIDCKKLKIRFRQGGEKIKFPKRQGTHDLKKLMQEWNIPPWLRDRIPLIYYENKIVAVIGYDTEWNQIITFHPSD